MHTILHFWQQHRKKFWIGLSLPLAFVAIALLHLYFIEGPSDVASRFLNDLASSRVAEAYFSTAAAFKQAGSLEQFHKFLTTNSVLVHSSHGTFHEQFPAPDVAELSTILVGTDKKMTPFTIRLQQFDGVWRVSGMQLGASSK